MGIDQRPTHGFVTNPAIDDCNPGGGAGQHSAAFATIPVRGRHTAAKWSASRRVWRGGDTLIAPPSFKQVDIDHRTGLASNKRRRGVANIRLAKQEPPPKSWSQRSGAVFQRATSKPGSEPRAGRLKRSVSNTF